MTVQRDHAGGAKSTTLSGSLSNSATLFTVTSGGGTGYPDGSSGAFVVTVDAGLAGEEKILCASRVGDTFSVTTRGYDGTLATAHNNLAVVEHTFSAVEAQELNDHIMAVSGVHGRTGALVGTTDTQTLTNKTLTAPTIGSFTNAQHDHSGAASGGTLTTKTYRLSVPIFQAFGTTTVTGGDLLPAYFPSVPSGQTVTLVGARTWRDAGSNTTVKIQKNGVDVTGLTAMVLSTGTPTVGTCSSAIADGDKIAPVVSSSGAPVNASITLYFAVTVP